MRYLTEQERKEIEFACDMITGNINRMCTTDDFSDLHDNAGYAIQQIFQILHVTSHRFSDLTNEVIE